jgi:hypothetical protein
VPERNYHKPFVENLVVDVIPNSGKVQATQPGVARRARLRANPRLGREQCYGFLKINADGVWGRRPVLRPPRRSRGDLYCGARRDLNDKHFAQAIRRRRSSTSSAEMVSPLAT